MSGRGRELVNVSEAARRLHVPRTTIVTWIRRGDLLHPAGLDVDGTRLYDLEKVREIASVRRTR